MNETISRIHGYGSNSTLSEIMSDFKDNSDVMVLNLESSEDGRKARLELDINHSTDDLSDRSDASFTGELVSGGSIVGDQRGGGLGGEMARS